MALAVQPLPPSLQACVVAIDRDDQALGDLKATAADASKLMVITCDVSDMRR